VKPAVGGIKTIYDDQRNRRGQAHFQELIVGLIIEESLCLTREVVMGFIIEESLCLTREVVMGVIIGERLGLTREVVMGLV